MPEIEDALAKGHALTDVRTRIEVTIAVGKDDGTPVTRKLTAFREDADSVQQLKDAFAGDLDDLITQARA